ncbi:hypothetical protein F2Q70_00045235 [Brassica cretica]|uniref:Uncharacterized protein n=1 Tax=Brassica cretica TaxID=69181 RepID=A0A8S9KHM2_BRACR|nr:hypothetical protein F2Q70_00045235 [Brassica cretica]KAF2607345.1 hypothetical protein F2Q68_00046249 [Brassica cretica]
MRKGFTWKLDQSMRIRIQVLLLEPSSLLMILRGELAVRFHCSSDASVIGLCGYIYKKFMVFVSADAKVRVYIKPSSQRGSREHKNACFILHRDSFFILFASYTNSLYARARIMEKQHSIMIFKVFFAFTIAAATISHSILLSPDSSKATNAAASSKIASEEERKMWINGEPSDLR